MNKIDQTTPIQSLILKMFANFLLIVGYFPTEQPADSIAVQSQTFEALEGRIVRKHRVAVHPVHQHDIRANITRVQPDRVALFVGGFSQLARAELLATFALVAAAVSEIFQWRGKPLVFSLISERCCQLSYTILSPNLLTLFSLL